MNKGSARLALVWSSPPDLHPGQCGPGGCLSARLVADDHRLLRHNLARDRACFHPSRALPDDKSSDSKLPPKTFMTESDAIITSNLWRACRRTGNIAALTTLLIVNLVLIVIGTYFRGPNWALVTPW